MPVAPTYPGVYIEEKPSGVRTITGVPTSITAFVGRAVRGPVNEPVSIHSFGDFERIFGGLWTESTMSYAVRDFYQNDGSSGIVVRLFHPYFATSLDRDNTFAAAKAAADLAGQAVIDAATAAAGKPTPSGDSVRLAARNAANAFPPDPDPSKSAASTAADTVAKAAEAAAAAGSTAPAVQAATVAAKAGASTAAAGGVAPVTKARLAVDTLNLEAANEGMWGNNLRARIDWNVKNDPGNILFNLSVKDTGTGLIEVVRNVSVQAGHPRSVDKVLVNESVLVRVRGAVPAARPAKNTDPQPSDDPFSDALSSQVGADGLASDGKVLDRSDYTTGPNLAANKQGLYTLEKADLFNILCLPPLTAAIDIPKELWSDGAGYCEKRRAFLLVDAPSAWKKADAQSKLDSDVGLASKNAAIFFPWLLESNPKHDGQIESFAPCGAVAGVFSRTDSERGVWKAPAGLDAILKGVPALTVSLTDAENGDLNPLGINCLRSMPPSGRLVWGSRTLVGDDRLASEWKYIAVRRMALFLEESLYRGTQWVVFEPNDEPLWAQIRLNLGAFMHGLFRQGAFQGQTPQAAYFVKCDKETTTQNDINLGIVNIVVGFAPLKPAEFVIVQIQQIAGQVAA